MTEELQEQEIVMVEENNREKIIDYEYTLNLLESTQASQDTELLEGELKSVIIETNKPVDIKISFRERDIMLYDVRTFTGVRYLPLKVDSISSINERFNYSAERWHLNDALSIKIEGQTGTEVKFIFRVC